MRVATVFSGIGAFEYALKELQIKHQIVFACDCGDRKVELSQKEIDEIKLFKNSKERNAKVEAYYSARKKENRVKQTYQLNYKLDDDRWFTDIRFLDGKPYKDTIDIFVGGSPCQSFSLMGKRRGLEDTRGTLFYEFARLVKEIQPKVFIFENVPGMLVHDKGNTWQTIKSVFEELNYRYFYRVLNAEDFEIPQSRKRLFVVGFKGESGSNFEFPKGKKLEKTAVDFLEKQIEPKYYLGKKGFEFVTNKKYSGRAKINSAIIRTEKRNQQFNWNGDFRFEPLSTIKNQDILKRAYVGNYDGKVGVCRKLTPRECHRLMGFNDDFIINPTDVDAYKQAGNSIVVNVLKEIIKEILKAQKND